MDKPHRQSITMDEIIENLPVPVMIVRHHTVIYGNHSFWEFYLPDDTQGIPLPKNTPNIDIYNLVKQDNRGALREFLISLSTQEKSFETILISADKEYTPVLIYGRCLNPKSDIENRIHLLCCTDISAKLKNEFLLYEMLEEIDEIFFVISLEGRIQYINKRGLMLLHANEETIKNQVYSQIFTEIQWPHLSNIIQMAQRSMMPVHDQEIIVRLKSGIRSYLANIVPIHDFNHTYSLLMCSLHDITKFNEKISLASQLEKIIQSIPDPMIIVDQHLEIRLMNNASLEFCDINPIQIRNAAMPLCSDVFHTSDCGTKNCPMYKVLKEDESIRDNEIQINDSSGKEHTFLLSIIQLNMNASSQLFLLRYSDITRKKEYERELKIYQQKLKEENTKLQEKIFQMKITPVHESPSQQSAVPSRKVESKPVEHMLEPGTTYLSITETNSKAYPYFLQEVHAGKLGLVISRTHPDKIRKQYNLKETPIVWVNSTKVDEQHKYVQPNLQILLHLVKNFLKETQEKEENCIILIDCIEYLGIYNEYKKLIQFFEVINENITLFQAKCIVRITSEAFDPRQMTLFKRSTALLD